VGALAGTFKNALHHSTGAAIRYDRGLGRPLNNSLGGAVALAQTTWPLPLCR
jgi:hypothetical protein